MSLFIFVTELSFFSCVVRVLYMFGLQVPYQIYNLHIFSSILWVFFFHFLGDIFEMQKFLILMKSNSPVLFSFDACAFGVI